MDWWTLFLFVGAANALTSCYDEVVTRAEWGARAPGGSTTMTTPVDHVVVHHTDGSSCYSYSACCSAVKGIQNYHMDYNGWWDIGYTFLIGQDGLIYEGRGWDTTGAHAGVSTYNDNSLGVSYLGTFTSSQPNAASIDALDRLITCAIENGKLQSFYQLRGHRDAKSTSCPGDTFWNYLYSNAVHFYSNPKPYRFECSD